MHRMHRMHSLLALLFCVASCQLFSTVTVDSIMQESTQITPTFTDVITRTASTPHTLPGGQVLLVEAAEQINICGTLPPLYGIRGRPSGIAFTEYSSICNLFGFGVANISYTDLSTIFPLLQNCGQVNGGMWFNALEGYTDNNCLIFSDRYF